MNEIIDFLRSLGWSLDDWRSGPTYISPDGEHCVVLEGNGWELSHFDDADLVGVATPRWVLDEEGETLVELQAVLAAQAKASEVRMFEFQRWLGNTRS